MDNVNKTIVQILKENARTPFLDIAKTCSVSEGTIRNRVKQLLANNIIRQFTIRTNRPRAFVGVQTNPNTPTIDIVKEIAAFAQTYEVAGTFDIMCSIEADTLQELNTLIEKIRTTQGVTGTEMFTVLTKGA